MNYKNTIYTNIVYKTVAIIAIVSFAINMLIPQLAIAEDGNDIVGQDMCPINMTIELSEEGKTIQMKKWVLNRIEEAGLDPHTASVVISCESRWDSDAMGVDTNRTVDLGLWQINSIHQDISNADKLDYKKATDWAINKRLNDGSWYAWYCARRLVYGN